MILHRIGNGCQRAEKIPGAGRDPRRPLPAGRYELYFPQTPGGYTSPGRTTVDTESQVPLADDRPFPFGFIIAPAFMGGLIWLCAMLARLNP